jgi:hypothetical protein
MIPARREVGMRESDVKKEIERLTDNLMAGADHMSDKGYSLSTIAKQEAFARARSDQFTINRYLFAMLEKTEYVEAWWTRPNRHWNGETPLSVYDRGREGQEEVFEYVLQCSYGGW